MTRPEKFENYVNKDRSRRKHYEKSWVRDHLKEYDFHSSYMKLEENYWDFIPYK